MLGRTHMIAGAVAGFLVEPHMFGVIVGALGGLIPDVDEPHSLLGRHLPFLSYPLNGVVGHRTLTHSLIFMVVITLLVLPFSAPLSLALGAGILSHLLADFFTGKIKLLWPLSLSVGIGVPHAAYRLIDGAARLSLILLCGWYRWLHLPDLFHWTGSLYSGLDNILSLLKKIRND